MVKPFLVKDCALAVVSTGVSVASIIEFREAIKTIPASSLYYHFWGRRIWGSFVLPEFHNDFAFWTHKFLHDDVLSERLGIIDPTSFPNIEQLRECLLEVFEQRIEEIEVVVWSTKENKFHFLRSETVIFDTDMQIKHPSDFKTALPLISTTSVFYHFIDARRRTEEGLDDFSTWLKQETTEYGELIEKIQTIDPYFLSLSEQKQKLIELVNEQ